MHRCFVLLASLAAVTTMHASPANRQETSPSGVATLPGEAMYPRTSLELWVDVAAVFADLKFRTDKNDRKRQVLVTSWRGYDERLFPDATALGMAAGERPLRVQLHVAVAPGRDPARIVVGSILEVERRDAGRITGALRYRNPAIDAWLFSLLDSRAGVRHEPMAATLEGRVAQSNRLMPAGSRDPCLSKPPAIPGSSIAAPVKVSDVRPVFPSLGADSGERKVLLRSELTEHGTLTNLVIENPSASFAHYEASARAAVGLWRFEPARLGGCPTVAVMSLTLNYTLR